ncbi:unnamed protein product, partial [marine sediment metagenome]
TYEQDMFLGLLGKLKRGKLDEVIIIKLIKHLRRVYTKGIVVDDGDIKPLIMMTFAGDNWLDYEAMLKLYGDYATYCGRYLEQNMRLTSYKRDSSETGASDYQPADRRQKALENLDARRRGDMIYQRRRA